MDDLNILEEKELKDLKEATEQLNQLKLHLGELEIKKLDLYGQVNALTARFSQMEKSLIEKYGKDSIINMETGAVKNKE